MTEKTQARADVLAVCLLILWAGMVLGFAFLVAPLLFSTLPSRDLAGRVAGMVVGRLDTAAWLAFGGALALVSLPRWIREEREAEAIGPQRLWAAAALAALLMCFASQFIVSPGLRSIRARMDAPVETLAPDHPDHLAYRKAHGLSRQFMFIRLLLALGLAAGVGFLPGKGGARDGKRGCPE